MFAKSDSQVFKTTDVLSIALASALVFMLCFNIGWSFYIPKFSQTVKAEAIINAYQIWEIQNSNFEKNKRLEKEQSVAARELASQSVVEKQGTIGRDPWNNPYHFQIRVSDDLKKQIVVWSGGPDGKSSSDDIIPNFSGDDDGEILVINL
jgi:hypothetical protein